MKRIPMLEMQNTIKQAFLNIGLNEDDALLCAKIHTESSLDGVYSHGLNRVERFCSYVKEGFVDITATIEKVKEFSCIEIYDGHRGIGIKNATFSIKRAMEIAKKHGMGLVALRNTTHWMRGGSYGLMAAREGFMSMCFTNTESCMPAWGAVDKKVGNNPFVISLRNKEDIMLLDMAMSQYSYGKLQVTRLKGEKLPYKGGFDEDGNLTDDPALIEKSMRILPTGMWKGSALTIMLDAMASILSMGNSTCEIDKINKGSCSGCSQIFMVFDVDKFGGQEYSNQIAQDICNYVNSSICDKDVKEVCFPGQRTKVRREDNLLNGIIVDEGVWNTVCKLAGNK